MTRNIKMAGNKLELCTARKCYMMVGVSKFLHHECVIWGMWLGNNTEAARHAGTQLQRVSRYTHNFLANLCVSCKQETTLEMMKTSGLLSSKQNTGRPQQV